MNTPRDIAVPLERITWRTGQTLAARDLRAETSYLDRHRYMHVRYQHRTWGVATGLHVSRLTGRGVAVTAGVAFDIEGRELLLPRLTGFAAPDVLKATTLYLVISFAPPPKGCTPAPDLSTICPGLRNPRALEAAALSWKTVTEVRYGTDVLLARVLLADGEVQGSPDNSVQRPVAVLSQPAMWSDITEAGQTGWRDGVRRRVREIEATVDSTDAGFLETPAYFVTVAGATQPVMSFLSATTSTAFTLVLRAVPSSNAASEFEGFTAAAAEKAGWRISWLAIEAQKGGTE